MEKPNKSVSVIKNRRKSPFQDKYRDKLAVDLGRYKEQRIRINGGRETAGEGAWKYMVSDGGDELLPRRHNEWGEVLWG